MSEPTAPPAPPVIKPPTHATYIPERRPAWKYHNNIGQAKNACSYMRRESYLYEVVNGELRELYHITPSSSGYRWGSDEMPWNNTNEAKQKERAIKIKEIESKLNWHRQQITTLSDELGELIVQD